MSSWTCSETPEPPKSRKERAIALPSGTRPALLGGCMELIHEDQAPAIARLETRLVEFYNTFTGYDAFNAPPEYPVLWGEVLRLARAQPARPCRVLEIGAGRSGFARFLRTQGGARGNSSHLAGHHDGEPRPPAREFRRGHHRQHRPAGKAPGT